MLPTANLLRRRLDMTGVAETFEVHLVVGATLGTRRAVQRRNMVNLKRQSDHLTPIIGRKVVPVVVIPESLAALAHDMSELDRPLSRRVPRMVHGKERRAPI